MSDKDNERVNQQDCDKTPDCCESSTDGGSDCCSFGSYSSGKGRGWRTGIFLIVILLAGGVAAHSLLTDDAVATAEQGCDTATGCCPSVLADVEQGQSSGAATVIGQIVNEKSSGAESESGCCASKDAPAKAATGCCPSDAESKAQVSQEATPGCCPSEK